MKASPSLRPIKLLGGTEGGREPLSPRREPHLGACEDTYTPGEVSTGRGSRLWPPVDFVCHTHRVPVCKALSPGGFYSDGTQCQ